MIQWERIEGSDKTPLLRAKVPGGWLVLIDYFTYYTELDLNNNYSITFYPDPQHLWDGNSLP